MRLRVAANLLSLFCAWVLWEKWISHHPGEATQRIVQAVAESITLAECRAASPDFAKKRVAGFRVAYKEPNYAVHEGESAAFVVDKRRKTTVQEYVYYCLPPTVDPYKDPQ